MFIPKTDHINPISVPLASSKSESNRALIMDALMKEKADISNLSSARDTQIMKELLKSLENSSDNTLDVLDAGTVMRFMTAYLCLSHSENIITGTERMLKRPIGLLVDALRKIGADITYVGEDGYPPLRITGLKNQNSTEIRIPGNISSQYISALLMIAPILPKGLTIHLEGEVYSLPYINMTLSLMGNFGIESNFSDAVITIKNQEYKTGSYIIESDWSGASYWYSIASLSSVTEIQLEGLRESSHQGDSTIVEIMTSLGVRTIFNNQGVTLIKQELDSSFDYDFRHCPDLAQTIIALGAAHKIPLNMRGLESLKIKETDRIAAMAAEVKKIGAILESPEEGLWTLRFIPDFKVSEPVKFLTYEDHRMAMALAPLCLKYDIHIEEPEVVKKSYPEYWDHMEMAGIKLQH